MQTFYYFLKEQPGYPNKIMAKSKAEVKSLLMESLADEESILRIVSEAELKNTNNIQNSSNMQAMYADANDFKDGNSFMNAMIKSASALANESSKTSKPKVENVVVEAEPVVQKASVQSMNPVESPVKFFEEAGIKFKLENGKLYKKEWKEISETDEFRVISIKTNKEVDKAKFKVEKLCWSEINS